MQWERIFLLLILRGAKQIYYQLSLIAEIIIVHCYQQNEKSRDEAFQAHKYATNQSYKMVQAPRMLKDSFPIVSKSFKKGKLVNKHSEVKVLRQRGAY